MIFTNKTSRCVAVVYLLVAILASSSGPRSAVLAQDAPPDVSDLPVCPLLKTPGSPPFNQNRPTLRRSVREPWDELSAEELNFVTEFLMDELGIVNETYPNPWADDYLFFAMVEEPSKESMLRYLESSVRENLPERYARATVVFGADGYLMEYLVGPLEFPNFDPARATDVTLSPLTEPGDLPRKVKPFDFGELLYLDLFIGSVLSNYATFLETAFGSPFEGSFSCLVLEKDCAPSTITWRPHIYGDLSTDPQGYTVTMIRAGDLLDNEHSYPLPMHFWLDLSSGTDMEGWQIRELVYNDQFFSTLQDLDEALEAGTLVYAPLEPFEENPLWQTLRQRTSQRPMNEVPAPSSVSPTYRYMFTNERWVDWMGWSFYVKNRLRTGIALFDVQFQGQRYAYEISLQELHAAYTGYEPHLANQLFYDSFFALGSESKNGALVPGIDCPADATFFFRNFFCLYEHDVGRPLWRHNRNTEPPFQYAGAKNTILVLRAIYTVGNYDYVVELHFLLDGQIDIAFSASGHVWLGAYTPNEEPFGTRVQKESFAPLHTHYGAFKLDLDVGNAHQNCVEKTTVRYGDRDKIPGLPKEQPDWSVPRQGMHLKRSLLKNERSGKVVHSNRKPKEFKVVSCDDKNAWGYRRGLEIVHHNTPIALYEHPRFAKYHMLFTQRKEEEPYLTGPYDGQTIDEPYVQVEGSDNAMSNGESLMKKDVVAWVGLGFYHVPRAEDVPITNVIEAGFTIRPSNFYDENPSMDLAQSARSRNGVSTDDVMAAQCLYTL